MKLKALSLAALAIACAGFVSSAHADTVSFHSGNGSIGSVDSQITVNGTDAYVVTPNPAWPTLAGADWVSKYDAAGSVTRPQHSDTDDVYAMSFTLPTFTSASLSLDYSGDNHTVTFLLNGHDISAPSVDYSHLGHVDVSSYLVSGLNTMTFTVVDDGGPVGLIYNGQVVTAVPVPASAMGGSVLLAGLTLAKKLRRRQQA